MLRSGAVSKPFTSSQRRELKTRTRQVLLALGMLIAGTANTITAKATLSMVSLGGPFEHPFLMAGCMFSGEILCLLWHELCQRRGRRHATLGVPKHILALPALCDILGTSVMYVGLTLTSAATYQMLRGSVIIFTGVLSAIYLRRRQWPHHWFAMSLVFCGVLTVGTAYVVS